MLFQIQKCTIEHCLKSVAGKIQWVMKIKWKWQLRSFVTDTVYYGANNALSIGISLFTFVFGMKQTTKSQSIEAQNVFWGQLVRFYNNAPRVEHLIIFGTFSVLKKVNSTGHRHATTSSSSSFWSSHYKVVLLFFELRVQQPSLLLLSFAGLYIVVVNQDQLLSRFTRPLSARKRGGVGTH